MTTSYHTLYRCSWLLVSLLLLSGCSSAYYGAMEKVGVHKRDILVDRVDAARDAQAEAQTEFRSALERLDSLLNVDGGELESRYEALNADYEASQAAAEAVRERIAAVDDVAQALFDEWSDELDQYSNDNLRRDSAAKLRDTERRYGQLIDAMQRAAQKMDPILAKLLDNVLYLKHNLNASSLDTIRGEYQRLEADIGVLIADMERAIAESDSFIQTLQQ